MTDVTPLELVAQYCLEEINQTLHYYARWHPNPPNLAVFTRGSNGFVCRILLQEDAICLPAFQPSPWSALPLTVIPYAHPQLQELLLEQIYLVDLQRDPGDTPA